MSSLELRSRYEEELVDAEASVRGYCDEKDHWRHIKTEHGVVLKSFQPKAGDGADVPVFKVQGFLPLSPEDVINKIFLSHEVRHVWNPSWNAQEIVETWQGTGGESYCLYWDSQNGAVGGLVSPRDFCEVRVIKQTTDGAWWFLFTTPKNGDSRIPHRHGFVRGTIFPSGYKMVAVDGGCQVTFCTHLNLGGRLPQWAINRGIQAELVAFYTKLQHHYANHT